jgi:hypothetical protein
MSDECAVWGESIPDKYGKFDPNAPVYADDYVYHKGCEGEVFDGVIWEL